MLSNHTNGVLHVQVCESTGVVVAPYTDFPQLLSVLLRMLGEGGDMAVKRDLLRLLGILGALDPHQHKARRSQHARVQITDAGAGRVKVRVGLG